MKKIKKQHYVPQLYLGAFAPEGQLYVFDKTSGNSYLSSVRDAASQRFFYDIPELDKAVGGTQVLEKFFQPFETAAGLVLNALRKALLSNTFAAITVNERIDLSLFLAIQMLRTPESREYFAQFSLTLNKHVFLSWLHKRRPELLLDDKSFDLVMTDELRVSTQARAVLDHELRDRIAEIIFQHYWVILRNPFPTPFFTSDHPACNHGTVSHPVRSMQGLASFGAEILFPISPEHLLLIVEKGAFPHAAKSDGRMEILHAPDNVVYYNHWQVRHAFRFLYSAVDDFSLAKSMIEESPELANPRNPRVGVR